MYALCIAGFFSACSAPVENTKLTIIERDHGKPGNTISLKDTQAKAYVITFLAPECPLSLLYAETLSQTRDSFSKQPVLFIASFSGKAFSLPEIRHFLDSTGLKTSYAVTDQDQTLQHKLQATVTPEVFVLNSNFDVVYSGKIDNRVESLGVKRPAPTEFYLKDALNSLLKDETPRVSHTEAVGCYIE